ncbi:hypothetical protein HN709_03680 [Candidatus Peregrinibacteria bacterium]|jgi:hypothetical protein|nr:hypothetical protein [Candidatus Peregrinibacteria bacterium]MBT7736766.1 hypothetical protein [Candidatus Peregrinibacteria bacterium]
MTTTPREDGTTEGQPIAEVVAAVDPAVTVQNSAIRNDTGSEAVETLDKLTADASLEEMAERIPEVAAMFEMDQRSDYHSLVLDAHTRELGRNLLEDPFIANHPKRDFIALAGKLHDTGKTSPNGQQIHPRDPEKRQYVGHADVSARIASRVIDEHFVGINEEDKALIVGLVSLHAAALTLVKNFSENNEPNGKNLGAYDRFVAKVEAIPISMSLEERMKIVFAINRADKLGGWNSESPEDDPKVQEIKERAAQMLEGLEELHKALPTLIEAINKRRLGKKENDEKVPKAERKGDTGAGIKYDKSTGEYSVVGSRLSKKKKMATVLSPAQTDLVIQNLDSLGVPPQQQGVFEKALREGGLAGLGKARLGKYIGAVKRLVSEQ